MDEAQAWVSRLAEPGDADAISALRAEFWQDQRAKGSKESEPDCGVEAVTSLFRRPRTHLISANRRDEIGGYLLATVKLAPGTGGKVATIEEIFVSASHRSARLGQLLVSRALEIFAEDCADRIQLRVLEQNSAAREFWLRAGFRPYVSIFEMAS